MKCVLEKILHWKYIDSLQINYAEAWNFTKENLFDCDNTVI